MNLNVNSKRSKKSVEDGVVTVAQVLLQPLPRLLLGTGNLFLVIGRDMVGYWRGMLSVHSHTITKFPASLLMFHKLMIKGYITTPKTTESNQPRIMLLHPIMAVTLAVECSLSTSRTCSR